MVKKVTISLPPDIADRLDRAVASSKEERLSEVITLGAFSRRGVREITRSTLVTLALDRYLPELEQALHDAAE